MKQFFLFAALLVATTFGYADDAVKQDKSINSRQPITPMFYTGVIHLSDLDTSAAADAGMYTINAPGRYYVANDLSLAPDNDGVAGIQITASNVILDLNDTTIYQRTGSSSTGLIGIEVAASLSNIKIMNGRIQGLNVSVAGQINAGVVINSSANDILIEDVIVSGCTTASGSTGREVSGFLLNGCNDVRLINCESSNHTNGADWDGSNAGSVNGFKLITAGTDCSACVLENCIASLNSSTNENSYGFRLDSSEYTMILNCSAQNQTSSSSTSGDSAVGFYSNAGTGNLIEKCQSIGNTGGSHAGSLGIGLFLSSTEKYSTIKKCLAQSNDGGTGLGYGINIGASVADCSVGGNAVLSNTGTAGGFGILDNGATDVMYINNFAHSNRIPGGLVVNYSGTVFTTTMVSGGTHTSFTGLYSAKAGYDNLEIS